MMKKDGPLIRADVDVARFYETLFFSTRERLVSTWSSIDSLVGNFRSRMIMGSCTGLIDR